MNVSAMRREMSSAPSGTYPELMPLAQAIRSGSTSQWLHANHLPVRPNPAITSSQIITMPCRAQLADALQVAVGRHQDAVRADDGLEDDAGDRVRRPRTCRISSRCCERALALLGLGGRVERASGTGTGPQKWTMPAMPGSAAQRRGSPVRTIEPPVPPWYERYVDITLWRPV